MVLVEVTKLIRDYPNQIYWKCNDKVGKLSFDDDGFGTDIFKISDKDLDVLRKKYPERFSNIF